MNASDQKSEPRPAYYRRTLADGQCELFPAARDGSMPVFPGTAQGYTIEPITGFVPYYSNGRRTVLYWPTHFDPMGDASQVAAMAVGRTAAEIGESHERR